MISAGTSPEEGETRWFVEWVSEMDKRTCAVCAAEGDKDIRPLESLTVEPGGDTDCGAMCRCVLVLWTEEEVRRGRAERIGPLSDDAEVPGGDEG